VGLAAVIGDERPRRRAHEQVAERSQGEREQALGDALRESADGLGEWSPRRIWRLGFEKHGLDGTPLRSLNTTSRMPQTNWLLERE
jgi:hypothetical protein